MGPSVPGSRVAFWTSVFHTRIWETIPWGTDQVPCDATSSLAGPRVQPGLVRGHGRSVSRRSEPCASVYGFAVTVHNCLCTDKGHRLSRLAVRGEAASTWRAFDQLALEATVRALATLTRRSRSSRARGIHTESVTPYSLATFSNPVFERWLSNKNPEPHSPRGKHS